MLKFFMSLSLFAFTCFACDANCVTCHPSLVKNGKMNGDHKILENCVNCHVKNPDEENHGACGADCFSCHKIEKIKPAKIKEHKILKKCISCHASLDKELFTTENQSNSLDNNYLKNIINGGM